MLRLKILLNSILNLSDHAWKSKLNFCIQIKFINRYLKFTAIMKLITCNKQKTFFTFKRKKNHKWKDLSHAITKTAIRNSLPDSHWEDILPPINLLNNSFVWYALKSLHLHNTWRNIRTFTPDRSPSNAHMKDALKHSDKLGNSQCTRNSIKTRSSSYRKLKRDQWSLKNNLRHWKMKTHSLKNLHTTQARSKFLSSGNTFKTAILPYQLMMTLSLTQLLNLQDQISIKWAKSRSLFKIFWDSNRFNSNKKVLLSNSLII